MNQTPNWWKDFQRRGKFKAKQKQKNHRVRLRKTRKAQRQARKANR